MFVAGSFVAAIARIIDLVLNAYMWIIVQKCIERFQQLGSGASCVFSLSHVGAFTRQP